MIYFRQSTATSGVFGPFVDSTDGYTPETGLTISQADVRLSKNGGAFAQKNDATAASHDENGWYNVPLNTTDTNTLGSLIIAVNESGALPVWREFQVLPANVYDSLYTGTDNLNVTIDSESAALVVSSGNSAGWADGATAVEVWANATRSLTESVNVSGIDTGVIGEDQFQANSITTTVLAGNCITSSQIANDAIDANSIAADAISKIAAGTTASGVAAGFDDVADLTTTNSKIDDIAASGLNWVTASGFAVAGDEMALTLAALSNIVSSGDAAGWGAYASGVVDANLIQIDGQATSGNYAALNLKQLNIVNSSGTALIAQSLAAGYGAYFNSTAALHAAFAIHASGTAAGLEARGEGFGQGIHAVGGTAGAAGAKFQASTGTGSNGFEVDGDGVGAGLVATGGATGKDIDADELDNISGLIAALNDVSITEIVNSGNAANWSGVADVSNLALQSTLVSVSGYVSNLPTIDTIVSSGNAEGWNSIVTSVNVSGIDSSVLSEIVSSGDAAGWGDVSSLTIEGIASEVTASGNAAGWSDGATAAEVWAYGSRSLTDYSSLFNTVIDGTGTLVTLSSFYQYANSWVHGAIDHLDSGIYYYNTYRNSDGDILYTSLVSPSGRTIS